MTTLITTYQHDFPAPDVYRYNIAVQRELALKEGKLTLKCPQEPRKSEHKSPEGEWTRNQVMGMLLHPRVIPNVEEPKECVPDKKFKINLKPEQYPFPSAGCHQECPRYRTTYQIDFPDLYELCNRRFQNHATPIDMDIMGGIKDPCGKRANQENEISRYGRVKGITLNATALKNSLNGGGGGGSDKNGGGGGGGGGSGGSGGGNGGHRDGISGGSGGGAAGSNENPFCDSCIAPPTEYQDNISKIGDIIQKKRFHDHTHCKVSSCKHTYSLK